MMKRLLVLALVLSIATVANAALTITRDGPAQLVESDYVTITISGDGTDPVGSYFLGYSGPGTLSGPVMVYAGNVAGITEIPDPVLAGNLGHTNLPVYLFAWEDTPPPEPPTDPLPLDGILSTLVFHCDGEGLVTIELFDGNFVAMPGAILVIEQVPEPATMLLLGLGGLFLRRRK